MFPAITTAVQSLINLILGEVGIVILVSGAVGLYILWYLRGRDKPVGLVAEYLREPPSDLHPGVVGTLIDEHANHHDVIATLVNLGERGALRIRPIADRQGQLRDHLIEFVHRDLSFSQVEALLFGLLFGDGTTLQRDQVALSAIKGDFEKAVPQFKQALYAEVVEHGFFRTSPYAVRDRYWTIGCTTALLALCIGVPAAFLIPGFRLLLLPVVALNIIGIATYSMARAMPIKTPRGAEEAAKWLAFRRYLADIRRYEGDVEAVKGIFRRYLPYATAFGLEQHWVQTFKQTAVAAPAWYDPGEIIVYHGPSSVNLPGGGGGFGLPDLGGLAGAIPTGLSDLSGAGDALGSALDVASSGGGAALEAASEGLSGLLDAAASLFDW